MSRQPCSVGGPCSNIIRMYKLLASHLERGTMTGRTEFVRQVSVLFYQSPFPFKLEASSLYKYTPACKHSLKAI